MDCCKRKIQEVFAARELNSLNCSLLAKQIFISARACKKIAVLACSRMLTYDQVTIDKLNRNF